MIRKNQTVSATQGSTTSMVLQKIEDYISDNNIKIGDALPSEDFFVSYTSASRTSVREAITRMRSMGIIESRRRRGMKLIRSVALMDFIHFLTDEQPSTETLGHLGEFRSALELGLVPKIFRRITGDEVAALRKTYEQLAACLQDEAAWVEYNREFHRILIGATGNKMASWFWNMLHPFYQSLVSSSVDEREASLKRHLGIILALEKRDPFLFQQAMHEHHLARIDYQTTADGVLAAS